jgi:hypothetical protein
MAIKQSYSKEEIKTQIIKDRLSHIFKENTKNIAKILAYLIKRHKKNV